MSFTVLTKPGCQWCDRAKELLAARGHGYAERSLGSAAELREALTAAGHPGAAAHASTFPQVLHGAAFVGSCSQLAEYLDEPLLTPDTGSRRFTPFPIRYPDMWDMYLKAVASFWTADEISLAEDVVHWRERLSEDERHFIKHVLAFFAGSDGIVMENLQLNFGVEDRKSVV